MAFFAKADPAERQQRDLETKLKAKRANRDDLVQRRAAAEASAAAHREKAVKLASDGGGDDAALSAVENTMRGELDRVATLNAALATVEAAIADLEREIAQIVDHRCRAETAAAVATIVKKWGSASVVFNTAIGELVELARESAIIIPDAEPLKVFLEAVQQQVQPEANLITSVLEGHAKAVLAGTAPASLPKPAALAQPKIIEQPVTERMFAMRVVRWVDAKGVPQLADQYTDVDLTPAAASNGRRCNAVVPLDDPRTSNLRGVHGGRHPSVDKALDLDDAAACQTLQIDNTAALDPVVVANFTELRRGPVRTGTIPVQRI
jgi:hypothetical protein